MDINFKENIMAKLAVGEKMPNLTVNTVYETGKKINDLVGGKPTFFMVLRYIGCTVCRFDVHMLEQRYSEFTDKGAQVYVVMQSDPEVIKADLEGKKLPFDIICDPEYAFYDAFEIKAAADMQELVGGAEDLAKLQEKGAKAKEAGFEHGKYEGKEEQLPALFFVDGDCTVKVAHYGKNIADMPSLCDMLAMIDGECGCSCEK